MNGIVPVATIRTVSSGMRARSPSKRLRKTHGWGADRGVSARENRHRRRRRSSAPLGRNGSPAFSPKPSHPAALMASACGNAGRGRPGKIHEKSQGKVVGGGGVRSSYIRRTRKRQGVGLTTEGRRGNARARTSRGSAGPPGWGKRGLQPGPGRQAARPKGTAWCRDAAEGGGPVPARWSGTRRVPG